MRKNKPMPRRKSIADEDPAAPSFEAALTQLETLVDAMEHEPLPLEELVDSYEKGSALLDRCEALLQSARGRIELITLRNQSPIGPDAESRTGQTPELTLPSDPPDASDPDDDIRLF